MISPGASMISPFDASISMKAETEFESGAAAATGAYKFLDPYIFLEQ